MKRTFLLMITIGCVALAAACKIGDQKAPSTPMDFRFVCDAITGASYCVEPNTRLLTWTAPGDDGNSGRAFQYDIRYALDPMSTTLFDSAFQFINEDRPQRAGSQEVIFLPRMLLNYPLSFGLLARDEVIRESRLAFTPLVNLSYIRTPFESGLTTAEVDAGFGTVVESVGDLDDVGYGDLAVGAPRAVNPNNGQKTGAAMFYFNPSVANMMTFEENLPRAADALPVNLTIYGENAGDEFGASISGEGDFNGDGIADVVIGAPGAGKAYVYLGGPNGIARRLSTTPGGAATIEAATTADVVIAASTAGFGQSVAMLGDIDGRLNSELAVGSPQEGKAYVFYGGFQAGNAISGATPLNIDLSLQGADWTIIGPLGSDFGGRIARVGVMSGAFEEMAVSAPNLDLVYLFLGGNDPGRAIDFSLAGPQVHDLSAGDPFDALIQGQAGDEFGASLSGLADLSGEGFASLVIGAPGAGKVYVIHGGPSGKLLFPAPLNHVHNVLLDGADITITGSAAARFGESVSSRSDLNGDNQKDIMVGAPDASDGANTVGAVYEFTINVDNPFNRSESDADSVIWGKTPSGRFGASMEGVGEIVTHPPIINTERFEDFIVGAPFVNEAYTEY